MACAKCGTQLTPDGKCPKCDPEEQKPVTIKTEEQVDDPPPGPDVP